MAQIVNFVPNPDSVGGTSIEADLNTTVTAVGGTTDVQALTTGNAGARLKSALFPPTIVIGEAWSAAVVVRHDAAAQRTLTLSIRFYSSGVTVAAQYSANVNVEAGETKTIRVAGIVPSGGTKVGFAVTRASGAAGEHFYIDQSFLTNRSALPTALGTPNTASNWWWLGTPNASSSYTPITAPELTVFDDMDPCPRVLINFGELYPDTHRVTIFQSVGGVSTPVAGAEMILETGGVVKTDYYPPFAVAITYYAEMFNEAGNSIGRTDSTDTLVDHVGTVLSSPANPRLSVEVDLDEAFASSLEEGFSGQVHQIGDRRILLATSGTGLDNLDVSFWTDTIQQYRTAVQVLRDSKGLIVIRTSYPTEVSPTLYVWVPRSKRTQTDLPGGSQEYKFENVGSEVTPPSARVIFSPITYALFHAFYPTYRAFRDAYATYRDANLNPPPEV